MSKFVFIYAFFYAFSCFGAVAPTGTTIPAPATPSATMVATETATTTATNPALTTIPHEPITAEVSFSDGSFTLTPSGIQNIQIAMRAAGLQGQITEVRVLAWGDNPNVPGQAAPSPQITLADQRSQAVAGFVRASNPTAPVKTLNVTQNPTALQTLLADPSLGARSALGNVGVFNPDVSPKHSEAVLLVITR